MSNLDAEKFFSLKKPCRDCPFRSDLDFPLNSERRRQIAHDLHFGQNFVCHKTVEYHDEDHTDQSHAVACAGARETARRSGLVSQSEQIAERLGFKFGKVNEDVAVHDNLDSWIDAADD